MSCEVKDLAQYFMNAFLLAITSFCFSTHPTWKALACILSNEHINNTCHMKLNLPSDLQLFSSLHRTQFVFTTQKAAFVVMASSVKGRQCKMTMPAFFRPFQQKACLVPYEWKLFWNYKTSPFATHNNGIACLYSKCLCQPVGALLPRK